MGKGIVKCRVKNLRTGSITWEPLTGEKFEKAEVSTVEMDFSYLDGSNYVFMDQNTYDTIEIPSSKLEWEKNFIVEGVKFRVRKYGDEILDIALPDQVTLTVKDAEEAIQGNSVNSAGKKAWLETGWMVEVPQFIKKGEKIIVNTADGKYVGRGK
jgi:elongation factor P